MGHKFREKVKSSFIFLVIKLSKMQCDVMSKWILKNGHMPMVDFYSNSFLFPALFKIMSLNVLNAQFHHDCDVEWLQRSYDSLIF